MTALRKLVIIAVFAGLAPVPALPAGTTLPQYSRDASMGVASCASSLCHGAIDTWKNSPVLQNEYITWSRSDKHARAYLPLLNERSRDIARRLGLKEPAHASALCLDCHAHNVPDARRGERFVLADGVTCEACHGPSERWIQSHVGPNASHAQNIAHGMFPASDNVERARLCLSCHFGTRQKFVTHKMMAAGHPRMSFELDTFMQIQPPHYRIDTEAEKERQLWEGVRIWAIGQALAAFELLEILNDPKRGRDGLFPELVLFDCHSCHHAMSDKRQSGARMGVGPGVVRLNDASLLMLRQIARRVDPKGDAQFLQQVGRLHQAVASGNDTFARARAVQDLISQLLPRISAHNFSSADLGGMLIGLIDEGLAGQYRDYQGAEQAVMGLQSVVDFMRQRGLLGSAPVNPAMKRLLATVADDEKYRPAAFEQALRELKMSVLTGTAK
jgi:hypothetical protein